MKSRLILLGISLLGVFPGLSIVESMNLHELGRLAEALVQAYRQTVQSAGVWFLDRIGVDLGPGLIDYLACSAVLYSAYSRTVKHIFKKHWLMVVRERCSGSDLKRSLETGFAACIAVPIMIALMPVFYAIIVLFGPVDSKHERYTPAQKSTLRFWLVFFLVVELVEIAALAGAP